MWAFWKTSCKGSSKKKLCNTKPPTKPKSTGNTMEIRRILNLFCDAQRKTQMSQIHRNLHRKSFPSEFQIFFIVSFCKMLQIAEQSWSFRGRPFENNAPFVHFRGVFRLRETSPVWFDPWIIPTKKHRIFVGITSNDVVNQSGPQLLPRCIRQLGRIDIHTLSFLKAPGNISMVLFPTKKDCFLKP